MASTQFRILGLALAAVVVFASGFWLTRAGRPYSSAILNIHKLVALAAIIFIGVMLFRANSTASLSALQWILIGTTGGLAVALFVTGGVVSAIEVAPAWALWLHRIVPFPVGALAAVTVWFVLSRS